MKEDKYYESLDKRTKEYKDWKEKYDNAPSGLGDTIESITEKTGVKKIVKAVFGDDCGCKERKEKANELIRYKPVNCFTEEQFNQWTDFRNRENKNKITYEEQLFVVKMMEQLFARTTKPCPTCGGHIKGFVDRINKFYETYL